MIDMSILINSLTNPRSDRLLTRENFVPFCISRRDCKKKFCMCDLLDIDLQKIAPRHYTTLLICGKCYSELYDEYKIFENKVKDMDLRDDFMDSFVAVKILLMLNKIKKEFENNKCKCGNDCRSDDVTKEERKVIQEKFNLMYQVFGMSN
jgi:hypothetical protein